MYLRKDHAELSIPALYEFIHQNPLGVLTTGLSSESYPFLQSTHLPWVLDQTEDTATAVGSKLRGHLARANPHTKALVEAAQKISPEGTGPVQLKDEVMILFTSPVQHYVTPKFYVKTKPSTGKVVPTWNYAAVQAYGTATIYFSTGTETGEFLSKQISDLSALAEEDVMGYDGKEGRKGPWTVDESPETYVNLLKKAILGIEIEITRLEGKWKMSQELGAEDRQGAIEGFRALEKPLGNQMADLVQERGILKHGAIEK
ncbi:FMN-binding split barrel-2 [Coleophoma cylindrospora]|uniref:FMN-binding split barrel-2 n=1 Tax=Coleophoma cylindrospora TaxID=1849047 RepID=A0A3D8S1G9_9HELO|nr:FMN-binding split barrel-2 [Coleophoma cylindrospora]